MVIDVRQLKSDVPGLAFAKQQHKEMHMELWSELFSDWVGILSFGVIAFILVMAVFFIWFFMKESGDPDQ